MDEKTKTALKTATICLLVISIVLYLLLFEADNEKEAADCMRNIAFKACEDNSGSFPNYTDSWGIPLSGLPMSFTCIINREQKTLLFLKEEITNCRNKIIERGLL